jgi:hypothetical protein
MKNDTISKSFRLPKLDALWLKEMSDKLGVNQTEIISKALTNARLNEGKNLAIQSMSEGGITEDDEVINTLKQLGLATVGGFAGYHIAGFIRKELEMDEDKGTQVLFGMIVGLGTLLIQVYNKK